MSEETDKMFDTIEDFAKQEPEEEKEEKEEKITIPNLNDAPRRKRGRPKKTLTKDQLDAEKVLVGKIIRLMCVAFLRKEIAKALNIDEQTIKTLKKHYKINEFVKLNNLDVSHRINSTIENFLFGTIGNKEILEVKKKKDLSFEERLELLADIAQNRTIDATQRVQAIKAMGDLKGDKVKQLPEGELITLKLEDMFEPEEEVVEPEPEKGAIEIPFKKEDRKEGASTDIALEFVFDDSESDVEDLFKD